MRFLLLAFVLLTGCQYSGPEKGYDNIYNLTNENAVYAQSIKFLRFEMLRETALKFAAQSSLSHHYKLLCLAVEEQNSFLDKSFNFSPLILEQEIAPPVVLESAKTFEQIDLENIVLADKSFKISKPARFLTNPLTWRHYLVQDFPIPENPDRSLLPKDKVEQEVWRKYVDEGWEAGKKQAYETFKNNLNRLYQEYYGMICFHRLLQQGLIKAPVTAYYDQGIALNDGAMNVNQRIVKIVQNALLEPDYQQWHSYIFYVP